MNDISKFSCSFLILIIHNNNNNSFHMSFKIAHKCTTPQIYKINTLKNIFTIWKWDLILAVRGCCNKNLLHKIKIFYRNHNHNKIKNLYNHHLNHEIKLYYHLNLKIQILLYKTQYQIFLNQTKKNYLRYLNLYCNNNMFFHKNQNNELNHKKIHGFRVETVRF